MGNLALNPQPPHQRLADSLTCLALDKPWGPAPTPTQPTHVNVELHILPLAKPSEFIAVREEPGLRQTSESKWDDARREPAPPHCHSLGS